MQVESLFSCVFFIADSFAKTRASLLILFFGLLASLSHLLQNLLDVWAHYHCHSLLFIFFCSNEPFF
uniref:Uncharacterized protein n=1 Tax=Manihot esculenta TaxID=3983 RepID=A0A2C9WM24_MANES